MHVMRTQRMHLTILVANTKKIGHDQDKLIDCKLKNHGGYPFTRNSQAYRQEKENSLLMSVEQLDPEILRKN